MFFRATFLHAGLLLALAIPAASIARAQSLNIEVANMRQELDLLRQRLGELQLSVESLQRELADTRAAAAAADKQNYATVNQLNNAIADLNRLIKDTSSASKTDILRTVSAQMDTLVKQTNDALADMAKNINTAGRRTPAARTPPAPPATPPVFSDDYPKDGISYTVVPGDSLSRIAQKTGAKVEDIRNANKIANERALRPGQILFIPGSKPPPPPAPASPVEPAAVK